MVCGNCRHSRNAVDPESATPCTACKTMPTQGLGWAYCEECALDLGCCESCGDMLYDPRRPDLVQDLGIKPYFEKI